jgi:hypothetical protein
LASARAIDSRAMAFSKKNDHDFSSKMLKSQEKTKTAVKTIRFQVALAESNEKTCPELSYKDLVESEVMLKQSKLFASVN